MRIVRAFALPLYVALLVFLLLLTFCVVGGHAATTAEAALSTAAERTLSLMLNPAGQLVLLPVSGSPAPAVSAAGAGTIYFDSTSNTFQVSQSGAAYATLGTGGAICTTACTFTVSVTDPIVYGGTAAGSTLSLRGTSNGSPVNAYVNLNPSREGWVNIGAASGPQNAQDGASAYGLSIMAGAAAFGEVELATSNANNGTYAGRITFTDTSSTTARGAFITSQIDNSNGLYGQSIQFWVTNAGGALTNVLNLKQTAIGLGSPAPTNPTNALSLDGQAAKTFWMERNSTAATPGNNLTVQSGGAKLAGTDLAAGNLILNTGTTTGLGRAYITMQGFVPADATGTADNVAVDRKIVGAYKLLANNTPTAIVNVTDASNTVAAGMVKYSIQVFDGTNLQNDTGEFVYEVVNKGGVFSLNTITYATGWPKQALGSGTLTVTWTITAANPAVLTLNANSSLTPNAGYPRLTYTIDNLTSQAIAVQ